MAGADPVFTLTLMGTIFLVAWVALTAARQPVSGLSDFGQGLLGIASLFALLAAGWLYFLEGRNRARHELSAVATVVPLEAEEGVGMVLVQLAGTVTNRGAFPSDYECVGADIRGVRSQAPGRSTNFYFEIATDPLVPPPGNDQWRTCMEMEGKRWDRREARQRQRLGRDIPPRPFPPPDSGVRYGLFTLEAGESHTSSLEAVVPCTYAAVRLHFVVPKPGKDSVPEAKGLFPLVDACRASREIAAKGIVGSGGSSTRIEFGASGR